MESSELIPGEELEAFLSSPADPERLASILQADVISSHLKAAVSSRTVRFRCRGGKVEIEITDLRPGGRSTELREFEEKLITFLARGFEEIRREGQILTSELECQRCMKILRSTSVRCSSCGTSNLKAVAIPASITFVQGVPVEGRSNEELLDRLWELVTFLAI